MTVIFIVPSEKTITTCTNHTRIWIKYYENRQYRICLHITDRYTPLSIIHLTLRLRCICVVKPPMWYCNWPERNGSKPSWWHPVVLGSYPHRRTIRTSIKPLDPILQRYNILDPVYIVSSYIRLMIGMP